MSETNWWICLMIQGLMFLHQDLLRNCMGFFMPPQKSFIASLQISKCRVLSHPCKSIIAGYIFEAQQKTAGTSQLIFTDIHLLNVIRAERCRLWSLILFKSSGPKREKNSWRNTSVTIVFRMTCWFYEIVQEILSPTEASLFLIDFPVAIKKSNICLSLSLTPRGCRVLR